MGPIQVRVDQVVSALVAGRQQLSARVSFGSREVPLRFGWKGDPAPFPGDVALLGLAEAAICAGADLFIEAPVSRGLSDQLATLQARLALVQPNAWPLCVTAPSLPVDAAIERIAHYRGLLFDGRISSYRSFHWHADEIDCLVYISDFDGQQRRERPASHAIKSARHRTMDLEKPVLEIETNLRWMLEQLVPELVECQLLPALVSRVLATQLSSLVVPSPDQVLGSIVNPLPIDALGDCTVIAETRHLAEGESNQELLFRNHRILESLRVCWENPDRHYNCGRCPRCTRRVPGRRLIQLLERESAHHAKLRQI